MGPARGSGYVGRIQWKLEIGEKFGDGRRLISGGREKYRGKMEGEKGLGVIDADRGEAEDRGG